MKRLINVLQTLVDNGNTVLVIEHNLDIIKVADWLIDLGPEGGDKGGYIIAIGTPEDVARVPESHTGQFLIPYISGDRVYTAESSTNGKKPSRKKSEVDKTASCWYCRRILKSLSTQ